MFDWEHSFNKYTPNVPFRNALCSWKEHSKWSRFWDTPLPVSLATRSSLVSLSKFFKTLLQEAVASMTRSDDASHPCSLLYSRYREAGLVNLPQLCHSPRTGWKQGKKINRVGLIRHHVIISLELCGSEQNLWVYSTFRSVCSDRLQENARLWWVKLFNQFAPGIFLVFPDTHTGLFLAKNPPKF